MAESSASPLPRSSLSDPTALIAEAAAALTGQQFILAEYCISAAIEHYAPPSERAHRYVLRARIRRELGDEKRALADARRALTLAPDNADALAFVGEEIKPSSPPAAADPPAAAEPMRKLVIEEDEDDEDVAAAEWPEIASSDAALRNAIDANDLEGLKSALLSHAAGASADALSEARKARDKLQAKAKKAAQKRKAATRGSTDAAAPTEVAENSDGWGDEIVEKPGRGRCAIATKALDAGTIVEHFSGQPYACCLLPALQSRRCEYCYSDEGNLTACPSCKIVHYCSTRCKRADAENHAHECSPLAQKRSALSKLQPSPIAALRNECEPNSIGRYGGLLLAVRCLWRRHDSDGSDSFHDRLFDHLAQGPVTTDDEYLGELAAKTPNLLPPNVTASRVASLLGALRINMISIASHRHVQHSPELEGNTIIGVGCYPKAAILNHSCVPNCVLAYVGGSKLHVRTTRRIDQGEELCHSYADLAQPTRLRQTALSNKYGFVCDCSRCKGMLHDGEDVDFLMEAVLGGTGEEEEEEEDEEEVGRRIDVAMKTSEAMLAKAEQSSDARKAFKLTGQALETRRRCCHPLSMLRYHAESACFDLSVKLNETHTARECCRNVLSFLEMALGHVPWHPAISLERFQLGELEAKCGDKVAAHTLFDECVRCLIITHGIEHQLTQRVAKRRVEAARGARATANSAEGGGGGPPVQPPPPPSDGPRGPTAYWAAMEPETYLEID